MGLGAGVGEQDPVSSRVKPRGLEAVVDCLHLGVSLGKLVVGFLTA